MKLSLEIVVADRGWILEVIANAIREGSKEFEVSVVDEPSGTADVTYFIPYSCYRDLPGITGAMFTHQEAVEPALTRFIEVAKRVDFCICMSKKYEKILRNHGVKNVVTIITGVDLALFRPKLRIGVIGRAYSNTGRKGERLLKELGNIEGVEFIFTGNGWPRPSVRSTTFELPGIISTLDYLLVPSLIEGGPVPLMEALACGTPVICPTELGFAEEFSHIPYQLGDVGSLRRLLGELLEKKSVLRKEVEAYSWKEYGARVNAYLRGRLTHTTSRKAQPPNLSKVYIVSHGSEKQAKGGPSTRMKLLAEELKSRGIECEILFGADDLPDRPPNNVLCHVFNSWPLKTAEEVILKAKKKGYRVVYSPIALNLSSNKFYSADVPQLLSANHACFDEIGPFREMLPTAFEFMGASINTPIEGVRGHYATLRKTTSLADYIVLLSEYEKTFLEKIGCEINNKSSIVYNGLDVDVLCEADKALFPAKYEIQDYVLAVGRIESRKNQALLARAVAKTNLKLVLIGHVGEPQYFELVKKLIPTEQLVHIDRIEDRSMLASALFHAKIVCLPSFVEGAPLVAIEAGALGCQMLLSDMSGEREYFGSFAQYCHPLDVGRMADVLARTNGKQKDLALYVCERFSTRAHAEATLMCYEAAVNKRARVIVDVSHWAHSASNGIHPTGVTRVEERYFRQVDHDGLPAEYALYNSHSGTFIRLTRDQVLSNEHIELCKKNLNGVQQPLLPSADKINKPSRLDVFTESRRAVGIKKMVTNKYNSDGLVRVGIFALKITAYLICSRLGVLKETLERRRLENLPAVSSANSSTNAMRYSLSFPHGANFTLWGQPWISNDRYIGALEQLVSTYQLRVSFFVPDLLYFTLANSHGFVERLKYQERFLRMLALSTEVLCCSWRTAEDARKVLSFLGQKRPIRMVDIRGFSLSSDASTPVANLPEKYFLFVSSLNSRKGHLQLLAAWKFAKDCGLLKGIKLVLAGKDQSRGTILQKDIDWEKLGVRHIDSPDDQLLAQLYENCIATVYPSQVEGWGIPIDESIAFNKVCITTPQVPAASEGTSPLIEIIDYDDFFGWIDRLVYHAAK